MPLASAAQRPHPSNIRVNRLNADGSYERMLGVLRAVKWERAPEVTPIEPQGHEALSFFPGQRGYDGRVFPVGGLMLVANNFDNLTNWLTYKADLSAEDTTQSFARLRDYIIPASGRNCGECWLTNY